MKYKVFKMTKDEQIVEANSEEDAVSIAASNMNWTNHSVSTMAMEVHDVL